MKSETQLAIYQTDDGAIQLRLGGDGDTLLATQRQIADILGVKTPAINKHIKNILSEGELSKATISVLETVQTEGQRQVTRHIEHYNLDMIISVGYRVNSKTATKFRQWATKTLKQHITQGYTLNSHVLEQNRLSAESVIDQIKQLSAGNKRIQPDDVLELVKAFTHTWFSLQNYDEGKLPKQGKHKLELDIQASGLIKALAELKSDLKAKGEATDLFAQEKQQGKLEGIVGAVMQSVFGEDAYPSTEEKAAHLLYFVVKNHPFNDGNKRSGAFAFIWFLKQAGFSISHIINPNTLTALTLLIAESDPKQKGQMVGLVLQLLQFGNDANA